MQPLSTTYFSVSLHGLTLILVKNVQRAKNEIKRNFKEIPAHFVRCQQQYKHCDLNPQMVFYYFIIISKDMNMFYDLFKNMNASLFNFVIFYVIYVL